MHSSTVISAWKDGKLCGLVRVLDDSEMLAYVHYVLVNPKYQGLSIAGILLNWLKRSIRIICILRYKCQLKNVQF